MPSAPDDPPPYTPGRVRIGTCGDGETYDGDPTDEDHA